MMPSRTGGISGFKQENEMAKAQTDIRVTSYDSLTANPDGYQGTIEDALAQIRAEPDVPPKPITARQELLQFLGVTKAKITMSGIQALAPHYPSVYIFPLNENEDWSVDYGAPDTLDVSTEEGYISSDYTSWDRDDVGSPLARELLNWDLEHLPRNCS